MKSVLEWLRYVFHIRWDDVYWPPVTRKTLHPLHVLSPRNERLSSAEKHVVSFWKPEEPWAGGVGLTGGLLPCHYGCNLPTDGTEEVSVIHRSCQFNLGGLLVKLDGTCIYPVCLLSNHLKGVSQGGVLLLQLLHRSMRSILVHLSFSFIEQSVWLQTLVDFISHVIDHSNKRNANILLINLVDYDMYNCTVCACSLFWRFWPEGDKGKLLIRANLV